jgi:hypothetical protein
MARQIFICLLRHVSELAMTTPAGVCCEAAAAARLHNELRLIHFINHGGFNFRGYEPVGSDQQLQNCNVPQDKFSARPTGSRAIGAVFLRLGWLQVPVRRRAIPKGSGVSPYETQV